MSSPPALQDCLVRPEARAGVFRNSRVHGVPPHVPRKLALSSSVTSVNGELAQYFALAAHGSAWLHGAKTTSMSAELERSNSTFQFVGAVNFAGVGGVSGWLAGLSAQGVERIWLAVPDLRSAGEDGLALHQRAAFAGGLAAGLLTTGASGNDLWRASWEAGDRDAPDRRIWKVDYHRVRVAVGPQHPQVDDAAATLDAALAHAEEFASRAELEPWGAIFARARRQWSDPAAKAPYHQDLFPDHCYSQASRRLASMAQAAWVFGGMGSWNDLGFPESKIHSQYEQVSRDLFAAVMLACVASANSDLTMTL